MPGARGRSGGHRPGAGRPKGSQNLRTTGIQQLFVRAIAQQARATHAAAMRAFRRDGGDNPGPAPPSDDAQACARFIVKLLTRGALKGDGRCVVHLDERAHGRVPVALEGTDGPPIAVHQGGSVVYRCELSDGSPAFAVDAQAVPGRPHKKPDA